MNEDAVLLAIGGLTEAMKQTDLRIDRMETSLGREIRDLKDSLKEENKSCRTCRDGIDQALDAQATVMNNRLDGQDRKIAPLETLHVGEKAVGSWLDTGLGRIAVALSIISGVGSLFILVVWPVLQRVL
jgi:hypothetical protein